jgi:hypothetical protein
MKVKELIEALDWFDEDAEIAARNDRGTFSKWVSVSVSKKKFVKGKVVIVGTRGEDYVEVPKL